LKSKSPRSKDNEVFPCASCRYYKEKYPSYYTADIFDLHKAVCKTDHDMLQRFKGTRWESRMGELKLDSLPARRVNEVVETMNFDQPTDKVYGIDIPVAEPVFWTCKAVSPAVRAVEWKGKRQFVCGLPMTAVLKWMGSKGWTFKTARKPVADLKLKVSDDTLRSQLRCGVLGKKSHHGKMPKLDGEKEALLFSILGQPPEDKDERKDSDRAVLERPRKANGGRSRKDGKPRPTTGSRKPKTAAGKKQRSDAAKRTSNKHKKGRKGK
jgi:hypothetical protein